RRLDVSSAASRAYLAKLARLQAAAVAQVKAAIPSAQVQERYRVILDGFAVSVPTKKLPTLLRLKAVNKVYPSLGYFTTMDRGPSVIDATQFEQSSGDAGQGIKIGVVDTGVDPTNPFLSANGFSYPPGFPKGDTKLTTPKVIVARVFPGPVRDNRSTIPFDNTEPHGTHVAGIAAGDADTNAPAGPDHPATTGLSGVAPKAWIGNYRVFTVPTPLGHEADTPEIVAAFEAAVEDGMNVINFSGGGPMTDPANDAMYEAIHNTVLAGVTPVIAAGNDREDFGFGTAGSPGSAPDALTVAAVSNSHVFAPALSVAGGPPSLGAVPIQGSGAKFPGSWSTLNQTLVDAGSIVGTDGKPVDPYLCGSATQPNTSVGTLPTGSLTGKIVLLLRGNCTFASKAARAVRAGASGMIFVDNRFGEANPLPILLPIAAGMISDLDGKTLRAFMAENGGHASIRVSSSIQEIPTGRAGVITSFSSAGPTAFGYDLKPDISAPGLDVLSSTPPRTTGSTFAVFAGTSMATPHIAGAAAVLLEQHPSWSPWQVKSALMSTAGAAWADTARTQEASVLLEGAGLADVGAADDPKVFTAPQSLSFERIDVSTGAQVKSMLLMASDAGDGAGTWSVSVAPQAQTSGVQIDVPQQFSLAPGGDAEVPVVVRAAANAATGGNNGFIVLTGNGVTRRVPYSFFIERPGLRSITPIKLKKLQTGSTVVGQSKVSTYCCPSEPFGPAPSYTGPPMNEDGAEHVYWTSIDQPVVNFGV
ncbi:MAG TPA: S8 family serine peptidase, partial [Acidimicrobiia bacterium]|nr:S8 family serine peptidase [Acidimicrobiia bacterium]